MTACRVPLLGSCHSNLLAAAPFRGAAVCRGSKAAVGSRVPSLKSAGSQRSNASTAAVDAKGLSYLGDSIWTVSGRS